MKVTIDLNEKTLNQLKSIMELRGLTQDQAITFAIYAGQRKAVWKANRAERRKTTQ